MWFTATSIIALGSRFAALAIMGFCLVPEPVAAAGLYKWTDENGQIRYSDRLPADQARKRHQQLNKQGLVVTTTEAAQSPEQLAADAETRRKQEIEDAEAARIKAIQDEKDKVLLLTFSNEEELKLARDNRIDVVESVITLISKSVLASEEKLNELQTQADATYTSQGKEIPGGLMQKIEFFARRIELRNEQLELKFNEKLEIIDKYELDLQRFRLLKSESMESTASGEIPPADTDPPNPNQP